MQMIKVRKIHVATALILLAVLFSAASLLTNAQTILAATDVNVINIKSIVKTVWWQDAIPSGGILVSTGFSSWGRGTMHLMIRESGLTGSETMTIKILAPLYDKAHSSYYPILIAEIVLTQTEYEKVLAYPVPSAEFYFAAYGPVGDFVNLSYYLSV